MAKRALSDWQTEGFRLSAFTVEPNDPSRSSSWQALVGEPPQLSQTRPRDQVIKEEGPFLDGGLSVEVSTLRIDWRLGLDLTDASRDFPSIGPYDATLPKFRDLMVKWLGQCPRLKRLAFGAVLLNQAESRAEAYKVLEGLLPSVKVDPESARDLMYRVNRRRRSRSGAEGLEINRLSTWSVARISSALMDMDDAAPEGLKLRPLGAHRHACRLELDINTAPEFGQELDKTVLAALFVELTELGSEIALEGDIS